MMKISAPVVCLLMTGCAAELVREDARLVVVKARPSQTAEAQDVAEARCQLRGLHARLTTRPAEGELGFECVR